VQAAGPFPSPLAAAILAGMAGGFTPEAFIGRAEELGRLKGALDRADQEQPRLVLLAGDAGVGKTRLVVEFADRAQQRGSRVLVGGCVELGDIGVAYLPVVDALRGLVDDPEEADLVAEVAVTAPGLGRLLPEVARSGPTGALAGDGLEQLQVFDAVRALLLGRSQRSPVVVVLEDLHWADRATRDLVAFLARTLRSGRVLLVASYRSDELYRRHPLRPLLGELVRLPGVERLELGPFNRAELAAHLEATAGTPLPADQVERIYARSEGNPFYGEQLLAGHAGRAEVALPPTLLEVLSARVHVLSEPAQQVLGVAAVAGRRVSHPLLAQIAEWPEPDLEAALREAIAAGVLVADQTTGTYMFRHALLQEAVYADLLPGEQVRLHAAYARVLASTDGAAAELAHHCLQCHDLIGALAASVRAAEEAAAVLAPAETLRHLISALKLWKRVPDPTGVTAIDRMELTLRAAAAAHAAGDPQRSVALAQDAAGIADATADRSQAARAHERLGLYLINAGRAEDALRARARAVELCPRIRRAVCAHGSWPPWRRRSSMPDSGTRLAVGATRPSWPLAKPAAPTTRLTSWSPWALSSCSTILPAAASCMRRLERGPLTPATRKPSYGRCRISPGWSTSWATSRRLGSSGTMAPSWPSGPDLPGRCLGPTWVVASW
jgi:tetratricopeptide (TPR) repeat protein